MKNLTKVSLKLGITVERSDVKTECIKELKRRVEREKYNQTVNNKKEFWLAH